MPSWSAFCVCVFPRYASARVVMLCDVDKLRQAIGMTWVYARGSRLRSAAGGAVCSPMRRSNISGTLAPCLGCACHHRQRYEQSNRPQNRQSEEVIKISISRKSAISSVPGGVDFLRSVGLTAIDLRLLLEEDLASHTTPRRIDTTRGDETQLAGQGRRALSHDK